MVEWTKKNIIIFVSVSVAVFVGLVILLCVLLIKPKPKPPIPNPPAITIYSVDPGFVWVSLDVNYKLTVSKKYYEDLVSYIRDYARVSPEHIKYYLELYSSISKKKIGPLKCVFIEKNNDYLYIVVDKFVVNTEPNSYLMGNMYYSAPATEDGYIFKDYQLSYV
jgi:hypothetical protein